MKQMADILLEYMEIDILCMAVLTVIFGSLVRLNKRVGRATSSMFYWVSGCFFLSMFLDAASIMTVVFSSAGSSIGYILSIYKGFYFASLIAGAYFWLIYNEHELEHIISYDYKILVPAAVPAIIICTICATSFATGLLFTYDDDGTGHVTELIWMVASCYYLYLIVSLFFTVFHYFSNKKMLNDVSLRNSALFAMRRDVVLMIVPTAIALSSIGETIDFYPIGTVGITVAMTLVYIYTVGNTSRRSRIMVNGYAELYIWAYIVDMGTGNYRLIRKLGKNESGDSRYRVSLGKDFFTNSSAILRGAVRNEDLPLVLHEMTKSNIEKKVREEGSFSFIYRAENEDGEHYYRCQVLGIDTEDRKHQVIIGISDADEEMNREKQRIKLEQAAVINTLSLEYDCVFYIDTISNEALCYHQNDEIRELLGMEKIEEKTNFTNLIDMMSVSFVIPEDRGFFFEATRKGRILAELKTKKMYAVNFMVKALGREIYYQIKFCQDPACETNVIAGFHSVDEETREEIKRRDREQTNASKSEFLARMSHDIRTPVNGVVGMLELAKKNADDPDRVRDFLAKGDAAAHHLQSLVNDVLNLSRIENGKMEFAKEPMNVSAFADSCISIIKAQLINRDLKLVSKMDAFPHPNVLSDALKLRQVILNILGNAVKFTPDGGMIRFSVNEISADDNTVTFKFVIEDNGIGMEQEFISHIWEPFAQSEIGPRTNYLGSGLGMAITKEYVDMFGGVINVESKPREGSKFTVIIPFEINGSPVTVSDDDSNCADLKGKRVLLVEDNELNLEIARMLLEEEGMEVVCAENGKKACDIFSTSDIGSYDAILMDIMMPVMDGHEATRAIRAMDRPDAMLPIIAMTANAFEEDKNKAFEAGMDAHISKPIDTSTMVKTLSKYIMRNSRSNYSKASEPAPETEPAPKAEPAPETEPASDTESVHDMEQ